MRWSSLVSNHFGSELASLGACCWKYYSDIREGMKVNALTFSILVTEVEAEYVCVFLCEAISILNMFCKEKSPAFLCQAEK